MAENIRQNVVDMVLRRLKLRDDKEFFREQLNRFPRHYWQDVARGYIEQWREGVEETKVSYQKQNAGRRRANDWLRRLTTEEVL